MTGKPDKMRIVAETLAGLVSTGAAVTATAMGANPLVATFGKGILDGIFKYLVAKLPTESDPKVVLARIRDERTANTIETIRDALIEAMELKPEFKEPIEKLADAVQSGEDGRDEARFQEALLKLFTTVTEITATLKEVKEDTGVIREDTTALRSDMQEVKTALGIGADVSGKSVAGHQFLKVQVDSLSSQLHEVLDAEGKRHWEQISTAMAERSWRQAFDLAATMEKWLDEQGNRISAEVKVQGLLTLADVAVIRDSGFPFEDKQDVSEASRLLTKAEATASSDLAEETANRLLRVRAKLAYIEGDRREAQNILDSLSDPGAISLKLGMMEEEERWSEASDFAANQNEPHKKWAASALVAHVKADHIDRAQAILEWAKGQEVLTRKSCALAFVKTRYTDIIGEGMGISLQSLTDTDRKVLKDIQTILVEAFAGAFAAGPSSGIDAEALEMAILLGHVLHEFQACQDAADQLVKWEPVMPEMGRAVLRGDIAKVNGLADRFLNEHGNTFLTQMMAAMLLVEVEGDAARALDLLFPILGSTDIHQRQEIATTVLIGAQYCDMDTVRKAHQRVSDALGDEHRLAVMLRAVLLAKEGSLSEARSTIEPLADDDDHIWLQLSASFATQQNAWVDAAQLLHRIGDLTGHVEAYRHEAEAWYRAERIDKCVEPLEKAHQLLPEDGAIVRNLASAYHLSGRFADAARTYETVWQTQERTQALAVNYSNALVLTGKVPEAIGILQTYLLEAANRAELMPLLGCAHLLHTQGDAKSALEVLLPHWDRFDADHRYLMAVMQLGYASGREEDAHKAFEKLVGMLNQGTLPKGVLAKYTIDDMLAMHEQWNERRKHVDGFYLSGRLPWLIASNWIQPSNHCRPTTAISHG